MTLNSHFPALATAAITALAVVGCATSVATNIPQPSSSGPVMGDGHGAIDGVQEVAEAPLHLLTIGQAGGLTQLDLLDESVDDLGTLDDVSATATDGRFLFAVSAISGSVTVVDSGFWTWSHIDHFHYYRGTPRRVGTLESGDGRGGEATIAPGTAATGVFFPDSGEAVLLDAVGLANDHLTERLRVDAVPHVGLIAAVGTGALVTGSDDGGAPSRLDLVDARGQLVESVECDAASGSIETVVGTVVGCSDGAILATPGADGAVALDRIPYPGDTVEPAATAFTGREGRPTVAGIAGPTSFWLLDTRERTWQLIDAGTALLKVIAVDDADGNVLALTADGRVLMLSAETGETLAETAPLLEKTLADVGMFRGVELIADQHRAYLNAPTEKKLYEIDFADAARISRTFTTEQAPLFLAGTGR